MNFPGGWKMLMNINLYLCKLNIPVEDFLPCRWIKLFTPKCAYFLFIYLINFVWLLSAEIEGASDMKCLFFGLFIVLFFVF